MNRIASGSSASPRLAQLLRSAVIAAAAIVVGALSATPRATAQQERVLHNFSDNGKDGLGPEGSLTFDRAGNLFGTTYAGGIYNAGTVFELTPGAGGGWTRKILHNFNPSGKDGVNPRGGLIFDASGNLYGTTYVGGGPKDGGTVFELIPQVGGTWSERILHSFGNNPKDGEYPLGSLIFDASGNLYGTTVDGGSSSCSYGCGIVFELTPNATGGWAEKILASFNPGSGGSFPGGNLVFDNEGNLYGTTINGGDVTGCDGFGCGTVFELSPTALAPWTETVLYAFSGDGVDGQEPLGGVVFHASGNLYGITYQGGAYDSGTVFELKPASGGGWAESVLYTLGAPGDAANPFYCLPVFDMAGNLYGTAADGGLYGFGAVFELTPAQGGIWTESIPLSFDGTDGWSPSAGLILDAHGDLYGTTFEGGSSTYYGTVFELTP